MPWKCDYCGEFFNDVEYMKHVEKAFSGAGDTVSNHDLQNYIRVILSLKEQGIISLTGD